MQTAEHEIHMRMATDCMTSLCGQSMRASAHSVELVCDHHVTLDPRLPPPSTRSGVLKISESLGMRLVTLTAVHTNHLLKPLFERYFGFMWYGSSINVSIYICIHYAVKYLNETPPFTYLSFVVAALELSPHILIIAYLPRP